VGLRTLRYPKTRGWDAKTSGGQVQRQASSARAAVIREQQGIRYLQLCAAQHRKALRTQLIMAEQEEQEDEERLLHRNYEQREASERLASKRRLAK